MTQNAVIQFQRDNGLVATGIVNGITWYTLLSENGLIPPEPPIEPPKGSEENPFLISNAEELHNVRNNLSAHYKVTKDIDLTQYLSPGNPGYNNGEGWQPIGTWFPNFSGSVDGDGHKITGLWINRDNIEFVGLFGRIDNGTVKNLGVEIANTGIIGANTVGGLTGNIGSGTIKNCYTTGNVSGRSMVGGLAGYSGGSENRIVNIENCYTTGNITAANNVGGLVGFSANSGTIEGCYSTGNISSESFIAGGLVGSNSYDKIKNCYATGNVSSREMVGGLVGIIGHYGACEVENCYATGKSSGAFSVGGLIGNNNNSIIKNSFFDKETTGQVNGVGRGPNNGVSGKTTQELKMKSTFTEAGWDFENIWGINANRNNGYPYLQELRPELETFTYTVQGDTLEILAAKFGTTVEKIKRLNNLTTLTLYVGQELLIPGSNGLSV